jgi:hypothetical protein
MTARSDAGSMWWLWILIAIVAVIAMAGCQPLVGVSPEVEARLGTIEADVTGLETTIGDISTSVSAQVTSEVSAQVGDIQVEWHANIGDVDAKMETLTKRTSKVENDIAGGDLSKNNPTASGEGANAFWLQGEGPLVTVLALGILAVVGLGMWLLLGKGRKAAKAGGVANFALGKLMDVIEHSPNDACKTVKKDYAHILRGTQAAPLVREILRARGYSKPVQMPGEPNTVPRVRRR